MSCNDTNPCVPCSECQDTNPCYGDCGCLNPTKFECVTNPGNHPDIGVTDDMNGKEVLDAINTTIANLVVNPPTPGTDKFVQVTANDTTTNYLWDKIAVSPHIQKSILNSSADEKLKLTLLPVELISTDGGNILDIGSDGKLRAISPSASSNTYITNGSGVTVTGSGDLGDPYVISTNPSISAAKPCFDGIWHNVTLIAIGNANVTYVSGTPKYRIRFDGSIEFKGSATFTIAFGAYTTSNRKYTITIGNIPSTCLSLTEQAGVADLKNINYIDSPQAGADQYAQQYGYIIRKSTQNVIIEFQSAFLNATSKTIVVNFDGAVSHPNI